VADEMGNAQRAVWDGRRLATRRARDGGTPYVVAERGLNGSDDSLFVGATATAGQTWTDPDTGETF
jgi:hypothetical protein